MFYLSFLTSNFCTFLIAKVNLKQCVYFLHTRSMFYMPVFIFKEPIHLRNKELLILKAQLQKKVDELLKELENKKAKGKLASQNSPPRISSPINV